MECLYKKDGLEVITKKNLTDFNHKFTTAPFDIIKKIEKLTGLDANITLIG